MITVYFNGKPLTKIRKPSELSVVTDVDPDTPISAYTLDSDELAAWEDQERVSITRQLIGEKAGDAEAILGTVADAGQLLLFAHASLVASLSTAQTIEDVRNAAAPFAARAQDFLSKVNDGRVILPFMLKGEAATSDEIEARATAVAEAMIAAAYPDPS